MLDDSMQPQIGQVRNASSLNFESGSDSNSPKVCISNDDLSALRSEYKDNNQHIYKK
jgi:hypothetical protein